MTLILAQPAQLRPGSTDAEPIIYVGTGAEGNSFSVPALSGKVLSQVFRQGAILAITAGAAPSTSYIQYDGATVTTPSSSGTTFTLSAGDVVGAGEVFIFSWYVN